MKEYDYDEIKFEIGGMLFTWDDEKEKINIKKHGVDFSSAAGVFLDDDAVYECNFLDENTGEERLDVIGMTMGSLMFVVYVERLTSDDNKNIVRIISARFATKKESKVYVNGTR
ncbi:MAG: BrnT family toxin [Synergistaceae bacterium]|nr:BrnT family toxin [Synergistaceae bacterium]